MHDETLGIALWIGLVVAYAWSVVRLGRRGDREPTTGASERPGVAIEVAGVPAPGPAPVPHPSAGATATDRAS